MTTRVELFFNPNQDLYHASAALTGLLDLHRRGEIRLRILHDRSAPSDSLGILLNVWGQRKPRRVAIDLHDRSDVFFEKMLEFADLYLKRSFYAPHALSLREDQRRKIAPFGLNYACRSAAAAAYAARRYGVRYLVRFLNETLRRRGRSTALAITRRFTALPHARDFECSPDDPVEPIVLFQTRVWEPDDLGPDNSQEVNDIRVSLVRKLQKAFGDRFVGGLVPTSYAKEKYPDAVTANSTRRGDYAALGRRALIGVYSRGLHHSVAFKLAEYLAGSKAIVTDCIRNPLPSPLQDGVNYLVFNDPDDCVSKCERLFEDRDLITAMRRENHRYYRENVEPAAHMLKVINEAISPDFAPSPVLNA